MIRNKLDGERELINLTWGMPSPQRLPMAGRITASRAFATSTPSWRGWTRVKNRARAMDCLLRI